MKPFFSYQSVRALLSIITIFIFLIIGIQSLLIAKEFNQEKKYFNYSVINSLNNSLNRDQSEVEYLAGFGDKNSYPILTQGRSISELGSLITEGFKKEKLLLDFKLAFQKDRQDALDQHYQFTENEFHLEKNLSNKVDGMYNMPEVIYLKFPGRTAYLAKQMSSLIVVSFCLIIVLSGLLIFLWFAYKQRTWKETQKEFVNNIAHEFRTPVAVLNIASKVLLSENIAEYPSRLKKYAAIIKEQTDQLDLKVNLILESTLSYRQINLNKELVSLNEMILNAIELVQTTADEKKGRIEYKPLAGTDLQARADPLYLNQCLLNLLDNSLKYSEKPFIKIETTHSEKFCTIAVIDNGIGIEKKHHKYIFRKFYRIPTGNVHNVKGFGIGLNFVKKVIDAHNGRVEWSSVPGVGSEFKILLPIS